LLTRTEFLESIAPVISRSTVVAALGSTSREIFARYDHDRCFYLLGSMGMPTSVGLGLSARSHDDVLVVEGDGGLLMNLGALATVARYGGPNLRIVVVDNEAFESTGAQPGHTAHGTDLAAIARGCGIPRVCEVATAKGGKELADWLLEPGLALAVVKVWASNEKAPRVGLAPPEIFRRLQWSLAGANQ
jgi:thiamine pyrophosphate-dependent acetolactate synthase large subunit-like protein